MNKRHYKSSATDMALALRGEHGNGAVRTQEISGLLFKKIQNFQCSSYKEREKMFHLALDVKGKCQHKEKEFFLQNRQETPETTQKSAFSCREVPSVFPRHAAGSAAGSTHT